MSVLFLVRHGQASFGDDNYDQLSALGIRQARLLGEYLTRTEFRLDSVWCGTLARQYHTAREVLECFRNRGMSAPQPKELAELNEYNSRQIIMGIIPQLLQRNPSLQHDLDAMYAEKKAFQRVFEQVMLRWISADYEQPEMESWRAFTARVHAGIKHIIKEEGRGRRVMIFTSGGPIAAAMQLALGLSDENTMRLNWLIMNSSVTRLMYNDEQITLEGFNVISHLDLHNDASMITYR
ncbi:MAG: histidine phosphatase family protein [Deltaproteobacteria bacterium]|nr:histidine phosphatase family protein [Deltaproteobacteria bacterium]